MDEVSRYAVGIDVGTENVRAVVMSVARDGATSVVGYGEARNSGMRKGVVANLVGPGEAIDRMLVEVERMSGYEVNSAFLSINGAHVLSTKTEGMIALGPKDHEINESDLERVEDSATTGRIPANRDVLEVLPMGYVLDGQAGIRDPLGMTGSRLEIEANVLSALTPNCNNLRKAAEDVGKVHVERLIPSVVASARAILSERQMENGVAVVDFGAATTSVAVFEEGDLQYVGVLPVGSNNVTNDLAIVLEIDPDLAEDIKRRFVTGAFTDSDKDIIVKRGREEAHFKRAEVNKIVQVRLHEIFMGVRSELKRAGYDRRLPEGIVLVGGGAKMRDIEVFAKDVMEAAVRVGAPAGLSGVSEAIEKPEYASAVGLALYMAEYGGDSGSTRKKAKKNGGLFGGFFHKV